MKRQTILRGFSTVNANIAFEDLTRNGVESSARACNSPGLFFLARHGASGGMLSGFR
ncbi:MAG: hypothetical protein ACLSHC_11105 [Bilophila wadsworthia]